jgi:aspartokinase/homoserine dehydrogenase 1
MSDPLRERAERTELRGKPTSDSARECASARSRESIFPARSAKPSPAHVLQPRLVRDQPRVVAKKPLRVMKFGGTSVADAPCIARAVDIVRAAARESDVVVVVSAMSGVTNKLVEAASQSQAGNSQFVAAIFEELRTRHEDAANALIHSGEKRRRIRRKIRELLREGERHCQDAMKCRKTTLRARDAISGLGERLSAPLVAAALAERGVASEAIEATELIVTDACHGAAEPYMDLTRERCEARVRPLLRQGIVAVVTGFIGATVEGAPTTLGRNSSDFSGTIMGAALEADEVILWTDVDGILTADPRLVPGASPILEMSYREACDLADLGAKVLHPKTLHAVLRRGIPLSIRNTFAPDRPGTKITAAGSLSGAGVKAITASGDTALITVRCASVSGVPDILRRTLAAADSARANVRLTPQSSGSLCDVCVVVSSASAGQAVEEMRREFAPDMARESVRHIAFGPAVAVVTVVGHNLRDGSGIVERLSRALDRDSINILAFAPGSSMCSFSFVVAKDDMQAALVAAHGELQLAATNSLARRKSIR